MKNRFLFAIAFMSTFYLSAQTDGWRLYTMASTITEIVPDDTNANELHITTDIGYMKYNTSTDLITDFLNLTSQDPAIGKVNGISLDPTSNDIALALPDGIAIYNGATVTISNYSNSDLTIGETGGSPFIPLKVKYGRAGEIYIYKGDISGYQVFNNGVFDTEVTTTFKPQDIEENLAGTKAYFAGFNTGLHELVKSTSTWTNYTSTNSDLIYNPLECLNVDANDLLYIGSFQGLNTLTPAGVWNSYQQLAPPANVFFYPVYDISRNGTTGDLLIRTSEPNMSSNFGFTLLDLTTNTWTNYREDGTNCVDNNVLTASAMDSNGSIFVAPQDNSNPGVLNNFNPFTDNCTPLNTNYLNAVVANSSVISDIAIRKRNGNLDFAFTKSEELYMYSDADTLGPNGDQFPGWDLVTPSPGKNAFSVISDNDYFIVENDDGWVVIDEFNSTVETFHGLPNYLAITTNKAAAFDSDNRIITIVHKGFDAAFNYRVYKTQLNLNTGTATPPEELFTNDRDFTQNILFGASEDPLTGEVTSIAVETTMAGDINRSRVTWNGTTNGAATVDYDEFHGTAYPILDPIPFKDLVNSYDLFIEPANVTIRDNANGTISYIEFDEDNNGIPDKILANDPLSISDDDATYLIDVLLAFSRGSNHGVFMVVELKDLDESESSSRNTSMLNGAGIPDTRLDNYLPEDFFVIKMELEQYSPTQALIVLLTNYGLLIKSAVDISGLTLGVEDLEDNKSSVLLYPNPSNDIVSFSHNNIKTIEVFDINGRKVLNAEANSISIKTLSKGIYIVKGISSENISITRKLIKN